MSQYNLSQYNLSQYNLSQYNGDHQSSEPAAEAMTALALNQLHGEERTAAEAQLAAGGQSAEREVQEIQALAAALTAARNAEPLPQPSAELRKAIEERLEKVELPVRRRSGVKIAIALVAGGLLVLLCAVLVSANRAYQLAAARMQSGNHLKQIGGRMESIHGLSPSLQSSVGPKTRSGDHATNFIDVVPASPDVTAGPITVEESDSAVQLRAYGGNVTKTHAEAESHKQAVLAGLPQSTGGQGQQPPVQFGQYPSTGGVLDQGKMQFYDQRIAANPMAGQSVRMAVTPRIIVEDEAEETPGTEPAKITRPTRAFKARLPDGRTVPVTESEAKQIAELESRAAQTEATEIVSEVTRLEGRLKQRSSEGPAAEQYEVIIENAFLSPRQQPLSTFSIDVDTASYANVRRFLTSGRLPPVNSVRIEELVNYFKYDYPQPKAGEPFSVNMEVAECPWQTGHWLLRVGLKGQEVAKTERPNSNLVFLLDVSGSMQDENKLPLLKTAMNLLVGELGENDRVSIVTYAGEAGLRLAPTLGHERSKITAAIDSLSANGSTNGSAGINLAYEQSAAYFVKGGTNRVILCTDGDLNVGVTSDDALVELIKQKATGGTFLTVLGFGEGNLKDAKLEKLADNGNGLFAYIDSVREARRVLVEQLTGSTIAIAKDVKIQIEFNPLEIAAYRLLGYENRVMAAEDFHNDKKDASEIGAGHTVTALYELVPAGAMAQAVSPAAEPLKYQSVQGSGFRVQDGSPDSRDHRSAAVPATPDSRLTDAAKSGELLTLKLCYKQPEASESTLREYPLKDRGGSFHAASRDLQFAASVASFGMILRGSQHRGSGNLAAVLEIATTSLGDDAGGYRAEFVDLVRKAQALGAK